MDAADANGHTAWWPDVPGCGNGNNDRCVIKPSAELAALRRRVSRLLKSLGWDDADTLLQDLAISAMEQHANQPDDGVNVGDVEEEDAAAAQLEQYGGKGGGHHVPAKKAFEGEPNYNPKTALAIPDAELARLGLRHSAITGAQASLYAAFGKSGAKLTWETVEAIETQALVRAGMNPGAAKNTVQQAIAALQNSGVSGPTKIPWGGAK